MSSIPASNHQGNGLLRLVLGNLLLVASTSLPFALGLVALVARLLGHGTDENITEQMGGLIIVYLGLLAPSLFGAALYSCLLFLSARRIPAWKSALPFACLPALIVPFLILPVREILLGWPVMLGPLGGGAMHSIMSRLLLRRLAI